MNKLVKNYLYNAAYQIFLVIVPIITAPYLARVLSKDSIGIYGYVNSVVSIISTIGLLGLNSYAYRQIAYDRDNESETVKVFSQIFTLRVVLLAAVTVVYIPIAFISGYFGFFAIQYLLVAAQFVDISWVFIGFEDLKIVAFRNFLAKLLTVIGIFLFVHSDKDLWLYFFLFAFITLVTTLSIYPKARKWIYFDRTQVKGLFKHLIPSIKLFIPQIATMLYLQFDKVMLQLLSGGPTELAYYDYGEKIINIPLSVITALSTVMMPRLANLFSNNQKQEIEDHLNKTLQFAMFIAVPMMFGLAGIANNFIPWYLGETYAPTIRLLFILAPMCVLNTLSSIFGSQYLTAVNRTKVLTIAYYGAAIINIGLNALLIPKWGSYGAAIATVMCSLFSIIYQYIAIRRDVNMKKGLSCIVRYGLQGILMCAVVCVIGVFMPASPLSTILQVLAGIIVYAGVCLLTKDTMMYWAINQIKAVFTRKKR